MFTLLARLCRKNQRSRKGCTGRRTVAQARGCRPRIEQLESRTVPTAGLNETFVATLYHGALHESVDTAGLSYWAGALNAGTMTTTQVATRIFSSPAARAQVIATDYSTMLGRPVDAAGLNFWQQALTNGATLEDVAAQIGGSDEFFNHAGGTNDGFLNSLYQDMLGRNPDPVGMSFFGAELGQGVDRTTVAGQIASSPEADGYIIQGIYQNELGRHVDPLGALYWTAQLKSVGQDEEGVEGGVASSPEYIAAIANNLPDTNTNDPNQAATDIDDQTGRFTAEEQPNPTQPTIELTPASGLVLNASANDTTPSTQLTITANGPSNSQLSFQAQGSISVPNGSSIPLDISPGSGALDPQAPLTVTVSANAAGLASGTYTGPLTVTVSANAAGPAPDTQNASLTAANTSAPAASQTVTVTLTVAAAATGITGTYMGNYQGTGIPANAGPGVQVNGTLTLTITSATPIANSSAFAISGTIQTPSFFGQPIMVQFSGGPNGIGGVFDPQKGTALVSSDTTSYPTIQLTGNPSGNAAVSGTPGNYQLSGGIDIVDAQGNALLIPLSSFTLMQKGG